MIFCDKIDSAKCCVVDMADAYVRAVTFGNDNESMRNELFLMNAYIRALENYDTRDSVKVKKNILLTDKNILLVDNNKILSLGHIWIEENVNPDDINCLKEEEICRILEQISYSCESCLCGC